MAGISGPARGCPGAMSCPLAASQTFGTKDRVMLRAGRQSHLCKCRFQLPATQGQLSIIGRILLRGGLFLPKEGLWIFWWHLEMLLAVREQGRWAVQACPLHACSCVWKPSLASSPDV